MSIRFDSEDERITYLIDSFLEIEQEMQHAIMVLRGIEDQEKFKGWVKFMIEKVYGMAQSKLRALETGLTNIESIALLADKVLSMLVGLFNSLEMNMDDKQLSGWIRETLKEYENLLNLLPIPEARKKLWRTFEGKSDILLIVDNIAKAFHDLAVALDSIRENKEQVDALHLLRIKVQDYIGALKLEHVFTYWSGEFLNIQAATSHSVKINVLSGAVVGHIGDVFPITDLAGTIKNYKGLSHKTSYKEIEDLAKKIAETAKVIAQCISLEQQVRYLQGTNFEYLIEQSIKALYQGADIIEHYIKEEASKEEIEQKYEEVIEALLNEQAIKEVLKAHKIISEWIDKVREAETELYRVIDIKETRSWSEEDSKIVLMIDVTDEIFAWLNNETVEELFRRLLDRVKS